MKLLPVLVVFILALSVPANGLCLKTLYSFNILSSTMNIENGMSGAEMKQYIPLIQNGSLTYSESYLSFYNSLVAAVDLSYSLNCEFETIHYLKNSSLSMLGAIIDPNFYRYQLQKPQAELKFQPIVGHTYLFNITEGTKDYKIIKLLVLDISETQITIMWNIIDSSANRFYKCWVKSKWYEKEISSAKDYFGVSVWLLIASIVLTVGILVLIPWVACVEFRILKSKEY